MSGHFVWHELLTTTTREAIAFYTEVVGWKTRPFGEGPDPYVMWVGSQGPLGGTYPLPEEAAQMGAGPHWMGHVLVDDLQATLDRVDELGGQIRVPPRAIETVGSFSVIADPHGAILSVFQREGSMERHDTTRPGEFTWNELYSADAQKALEFYGRLFGWETLQEMDMGASGTYFIYGQKDRPYGGMMTSPPAAPEGWIYYVEVEDVAAALQRATMQGGTALMGPMEVPDKTLVAHLNDPQGAHFALHGPGKG